MTDAQHRPDTGVATWRTPRLTRLASADEAAGKANVAPTEVGSLAAPS